MKAINNVNNIKGAFVRKNRIIYPISKNKFNKSNSEYTKIFNNPISNRFIYKKIINKIKLKNPSLFLTKRKNHSESNNKINEIKNVSKNQKFINKIFFNENTNSHKIVINKKRIFTNTYEEKNKKLINIKTSEKTLKNENKIIHLNKKDDISFKEILKLWDYLNVSISYRKIFNAILNQLEKEERNKLISNEYIELDELKKDIESLLDNISLRKDIIVRLKYMNKNLKLIFKSEDKSLNIRLVKNMSNKIEKLRNVTINICFLMKKIKNKIYNGNMIGKYNIDKISQTYQFDKNYLIKMKEELNFLKEGNAKYFFNISEDKSPFLIKSSEKGNVSKEDPFIFIVPITEEIKNKIDKCNYIIYQELIAYQNRDFKNNIFRPISPICDFNSLFDESNYTMSKNSNKMNYSSLYLNQSQREMKKFIPKKVIDVKFPRLKRNKKYQKSTLKSNSCINFPLKSMELTNRTFFLTNIEKIKKNNIIEISKNEHNNYENS